MGIIAQNKISSLGMLFGAIALMMGIIHFSFGPFSAPPPTFESIVADKTAEIKRGLLAGIKGEKITTVEKKEDVDVDKILDQSGIALAIAALLCAFIAVGQSRQIHHDPHLIVFIVAPVCPIKQYHYVINFT